MVLPSGLIATIFTLYTCPFTSPEARSHTLRRVGRSCGKEPKVVIAKEQITVSRKWTHRTVLSSEPETMVLPSGLMATVFTSSVCPSNVLLTSPDARSHTLHRVGGFRSQN